MWNDPLVLIVAGLDLIGFAAVVVAFIWNWREQRKAGTDKRSARRRGIAA